MSFRVEKEKTKGKLTAREQRIFHQIAGQRKAEEQEKIIEQFEGPKSKSTPVKKKLALLTSPNMKLSKWVQEKAEIDKQVKNRLKKFKGWKKARIEQLKNKKHKLFGELWNQNGCSRSLMNSKVWSKYSSNWYKISKYEGFQKSETEPIWRFELGKEHPDRFVLCHACENPMKSMENMMIMTGGVCYHHECLSLLQK